MSICKAIIIGYFLLINMYIAILKSKYIQKL